MTEGPRLGEDGLRALRTRAQLLDRPQAGVPPGEIVRRMCGVQAQEVPSAALALRARACGITAADVEEARMVERSVVRTWVMRGTLHLVAADDVGWLLPLLAPRSFPDSQRRLAQLGVEGEAPRRAVRLIGEMLAKEGALTRAEIAERLARRGIRTQGQAAFHLVRLAALEGLICMGPDRGGKPAFVLLRDWIGPRSTWGKDAALVELARRYLLAYGPAVPEDMAAWSGLRLTEARKAWRSIEEELLEVDVGGQRAWTLRSQGIRSTSDGLVVRLLPGYDNYLLGYRNRDFALDSRHAREVHPGGGLLRPVVLVNGRVVATWGSKQRGMKLIIKVGPFDLLDLRVEEGIKAEATDLGRFLGAEVEFADG